MTRQSLSAVPTSVLRLENSGCGGSLHGGLRIGDVSLHFTATRVVSQAEQVAGGDVQMTVAYHDGDTLEDLDADTQRLCNCGAEVDQARHLDPDTRVFQTTAIPGFEGEWILTCHPYQIS